MENRDREQRPPLPGQSAFPFVQPEKPCGPSSDQFALAPAALEALPAAGDSKNNARFWEIQKALAYKAAIDALSAAESDQEGKDDEKPAE